MKKFIIPNFTISFGIIFFLTIVFSASYSSASTIAGNVRSGSKFYKNKKYDKALEKFREAQISAPDNPVIHFNIGDALYKLQNFDEANAEFNKALNSKDNLIKSKAYFNLGNSALSQQKTDEALTYYKKALDLNPDDLDAKYNIEYILYNKNKQDKSKDNKDDKNKNQDNKDKKQESKQGNQQDNKEDKDKMSKEDAKRILQYYDESDKNSAKKRKMSLPQIPKVEEDW